MNRLSIYCHNLTGKYIWIGNVLGWDDAERQYYIAAQTAFSYNPNANECNQLLREAKIHGLVNGWVVISHVSFERNDRVLIVDYGIDRVIDNTYRFLQTVIQFAAERLNDGKFIRQVEGS